MDQKKRGRPPTGEPHKKFIGIRLKPDLHEAVANAAYWARVSFNSIIEEGAALVLARLQKEHNKGKPFKPRPQG
jgi:predicted HicB family RNase H-like nuclease